MSESILLTRSAYRPSLSLAFESPLVVHAHFRMAQQMSAYLYFIARRAHRYRHVDDMLRFQREAAIWSAYSRRIQHGDDQ